MDTKFDFNERKTESEWIKTQDEFALRFVPKWYEFLNWVLILGLLNYMAELTNDWAIAIIYAVSNVGLWLYLQSVFFNIRFEGLPYVKNDRAKRLLSILLGGIIAGGVYVLVTSVVPKLGQFST